MSDRLAMLMDAVMAEEPGAQRRLLEHLRDAPVEDWLHVATHEASEFRTFAAHAIVEGPVDHRMVQAALELASDHDPGVRMALATAVSEAGLWSPRAVVLETLLVDPDVEVRLRAVDGARHEPSLLPQLIRLVRNDSELSVRVTAASALGSAVRPDDLEALIELLADMDARADRDGRLLWNILFAVDKALLRHPTFERAPSSDPDLLSVMHEICRRLSVAPNQMTSLWAYLERMGFEGRQADQGDDAHQAVPGQAGIISRSSPTGLPGIDLAQSAAEDGYRPPLHRDSVVDRLVALVTAPGAASAIALLGPSGVGKTAVVHELARRLADHDKRIIELSGYDVMAGTRYLGEWETNLVRILADVERRKGILYFPRFDQLVTTGRSSESERNVLDMLAPQIERGEVTMIGESTPDAYERTLAVYPHLDRLFTRVDVPVLSEAEIADIVRDAASASNVDLAPGVVDRLLDLSSDYLSGYENPDRSLRLLHGAAASGDGAVSEVSLLEYLHESTGIPIDLLDETRPLVRRDVRNRLQDQVMGQPDAVDAVAEVVMLIKAGLTDPGRPNGVLLFVGPTGVGKTELARALAVLVFGDADRLVRFDMSEYATFEAYERLIGTGTAATAELIDAVRNEPFSVILLDEIEKAHPNVYDLCLQIFDAGRLTDGLGRTASFHNTIVIMTSNVGAAFSAGGVGFISSSGAPDESEIRRALERHFRPEFLNRIDRIVPFRPLDMEIAERITRREIRSGLERKGLRRRGITVDVDPSLVALLLEQGYSQEYGARPLRRVVERVVLGPVADEIAAGRASDQTVLRLAADRGRLVVRRIVDHGRTAAEAEPDPSEFEPLVGRHAAIQERALDLRAEKSGLLEESASPEFWDDRPHALTVLDRIHRLDRVLSDVRRLGRDIERTERNPDPTRRASFIASHHREASRLEFLVDAGDLSDAFLVLRSIRRRGEPLDGIELLTGMYQGFGRRRQLEVVPFDDRVATDEPTATVLVGGAGAYALLRSEAGLHRFTRRRSAGDHQDLELVRVDVMPVPSVAGFADREVRVEVGPVADADWRIDEGGAGTEVSAFHQDTLRSVTLRSSVDQDEAAVRALLTLRAHVEYESSESADTTVRRYSFGVDSLVKDLRTGRSTGRVRDVLAGDIEALLTVES